MKICEICTNLTLSRLRRIKFNADAKNACPECRWGIISGKITQNNETMRKKMARKRKLKRIFGKTQRI